MFLAALGLELLPQGVISLWQAYLKSSHQLTLV